MSDSSHGGLGMVCPRCPSLQVLTRARHVWRVYVHAHTLAASPLEERACVRVHRLIRAGLCSCERRCSHIPHIQGKWDTLPRICTHILHNPHTSHHIHTQRDGLPHTRTHQACPTCPMSGLPHHVMTSWYMSGRGHSMTWATCPTSDPGLFKRASGWGGESHSNSTINMCDLHHTHTSTPQSPQGLFSTAHQGRVP